MFDCRVLDLSNYILVFTLGGCSKCMHLVVSTNLKNVKHACKKSLTPGRFSFLAMFDSLFRYDYYRKLNGENIAKQNGAVTCHTH